MNHRIGQWVFGLAVGSLVALGAYHWVSDTGRHAERQLQESVVLAARSHLQAVLSIGELELVDPIAPDRKVGKAYVYRDGAGWEVSGYYRRDDKDRWHPFLMSLDASETMVHLKIQDAALAGKGEHEPLLEVLP